MPFYFLFFFSFFTNVIQIQSTSLNIQIQIQHTFKLIFHDHNLLSSYALIFSLIEICNQSAFFQVQGLKRELVNAQKSRKMASASLRMALQKAAQIRLMEKEKNKSPSYAMRISLKIDKVVWSMLVDGKSFAEAELNDMVRD